MTIFNRVKNLFTTDPGEQVLGYAPAELLRLFPNSGVGDLAGVSNAYPKKFSLAPAGAHAVYAALLIGKSDIGKLMERVDGRFLLESTRQFQGKAVIQNKSMYSNARLCFLRTDEFEGHVIKFVTDCPDFLNDVDRCRFAPPPPWIAFEGCIPHCWGGSMQGAQEYYNDHFFAPFFFSLGAKDQKTYCEKYAASPDWENALALLCDAEKDH
jgi:hypothetical protein